MGGVLPIKPPSVAHVSGVDERPHIAETGFLNIPGIKDENMASTEVGTDG